MTERIKSEPTTITVRVPITFTVRGGRKLIIGDAPRFTSAPHTDNALIKALARAHAWQMAVESGEYASISELAQAQGLNQSYASRIFRLTLLAPDIVEAVLDGRQHPAISMERLRKPFSIVWAEQRSDFERSSVGEDK